VRNSDEYRNLYTPLGGADGPAVSQTLARTSSQTGHFRDVLTPRETDFDSVVITTWLRPVTFHASIVLEVSSESFQCSDRKNLSFNRFRTCAVQEEQISIPLWRPLGKDQIKRTFDDE